MKKIFTFSKILMFSFLLLGVSCNSGGGTGNTDGNGNTTDSNQTIIGTTQVTNIAYVRVDSVVQNYDMYHDLRKEFEQKAKKMDADFTAKVKKLEEDMTDFSQKYEKMLLTRSQAEEQGQRLEMRKNDLRDQVGPKMRAELAEEEEVMLHKINDALIRYIEKYNVEKKYSLILNNAMILVGSPTMDITSDILSGLNQEYIASKSK